MADEARGKHSKLEETLVTNLSKDDVANPNRQVHDSDLFSQNMLALPLATSTSEKKGGILPAGPLTANNIHSAVSAVDDTNAANSEAALSSTLRSVSSRGKPTSTHSELFHDSDHRDPPEEPVRKIVMCPGLETVPRRGLRKLKVGGNNAERGGTNQNPQIAVTCRSQAQQDLASMVAAKEIGFFIPAFDTDTNLPAELSARTEEGIVFRDIQLWLPRFEAFV